MKPYSSFDPEQALAIMESTILADQFKVISREDGQHNIEVKGVGSGDVSRENDKVVVSTASSRVEIKELG